jgi:ATP-dependent helicase HrpB
MRSLPIFEIRDKLLAELPQHRRLIVTAPTGSGKSTQVPQMLFDAGVLGAGQVVIMQPRRLPTRLLAGWVAKERGGKLGEEVGYQIRFDNVTSPQTRIRYVTEGVLLRQMLNEPTLPRVTAVIFDEFHERHLYGDITLARALQLQESARPDLLLVVMSATLDIAAVEKYLRPCSVLSSSGRTFAVQIEYLDKTVASFDKRGYNEPAIWDIAAEALDRSFQGDALVFMPGAYEINRTIAAVRDRHGGRFIVLPLHGDLPARDQDAAVAKYENPKVIVATNVAETSLTIEGVQFVVDSGAARVARYDPHRGINTLLVEKISRASADQRAGRAGRTAPGVCLRLWTQREHEQRPAQELPEVKRLDLAEVVLTLKASRVDDVKNFRWLEPPDSKALTRAEELLVDLAATDDQSQITDLGRRMLAFPLHPRYSRMLLAAQESGCVRAVALIAALTQGRDLLLRGQGKQVTEARDELFGGETESDFFVLMRAWRFAERNNFNVERCRRLGIHAQSARQVGPLFEQFLEIARREGLDVSERPMSREAVAKCLLAGFADHVAKRLDVGTLRCQLVHGRRGLLTRDSVVAAPLFVAGEVAEVEGRELKVMLSAATAVREEWLRVLFPDDFNSTEEMAYDETQRRVFVERRRTFRDLVLESERSGEPPAEAAAKILAHEIVAGRLVLKHWDAGVEQWILRVNRLQEWMPELGLAGVSDADRQMIVEQICVGASGYKEIKDRQVWPVVKSWLSKEQQGWLDEYAPERIELKSGRRAKVTYSSAGLPTIAARIQDLYGTNALAVAAGRVPVRIEILAPNNRPVQVTDNLATFWRETYPKLKVELQRKYPKHEWR